VAPLAPLRTLLTRPPPKLLTFEKPVARVELAFANERLDDEEEEDRVDDVDDEALEREPETDDIENSFEPGGALPLSRRRQESCAFSVFSKGWWRVPE
jgi:hypothetical protein